MSDSSIFFKKLKFLRELAYISTHQEEMWRLQ